MLDGIVVDGELDVVVDGDFDINGMQQLVDAAPAADQDLYLPIYLPTYLLIYLLPLPPKPT